MAKPEIHLGHETHATYSPYSIFNRSSADFRVEKPQVVGRIDTFPNQRPPISRVYVANTGQVYDHEHGSPREAINVQPHQRVEIISAALLHFAEEKSRSVELPVVEVRGMTGCFGPRYD